MSVYPRTDFVESKDAQKYPYIFKCDRIGCYYIVSARSHLEAEQSKEIHELNGSCPLTGGDATLMEEVDEKGQHYTQPHLGKSILERLWDQADADFERAWTMSNDGVREADCAKVFGVCRGLAVAIHMMASPFYPTVDDVVREIVRRKKQRDGEVAYQPTPGYKYNPAPPQVVAKARQDKHLKPVADQRPDTSQPHQSGRVLSDQEVAGIASALKSKIFDVPTLARTFKVPVARITEIADSLGLT